MSVSDFIGQFLEKFKCIQKALLNYLENEENVEENYQNLKQIFDDTKIRNCEHDVRLFLHLLLKVANHGHRVPYFFDKINRILQLFKDDLKKYKNEYIFQLFKSNKRLLLLLIEEKILTVDENFVKQIITKKHLAKNYPQYFAPEIKPFIKEKWFSKYDPMQNNNNSKQTWFEDIIKELPDNFFEERKIGENIVTSAN